VAGSYKVLICDPMPKDFVRLLQSRGLTVEERYGLSGEQLKELVKAFHVIVVRSSTKVTGDVIEAGDSLRVIARAGSGLDNIDVEAALRRGIKVVNTPEAVANAVAELTLCLILSLVRKAYLGYRALLEGKWLKHELVGREIAGMRVGVVGLGQIGSIVARKLSLLGAHVLAYRRDTALLHSIAREVGCTPVESLERLVEGSELVTIHVPYSRETHLMFDEKLLSRFKRESYLVNTSRAWIVDGPALLKMIDRGVIEGAAVDVHYNEPPREEWEWMLIRHPRVIATPHIGAQTREAKERMSALLADKILAALGKL